LVVSAGQRKLESQIGAYAYGSQHEQHNYSNIINNDAG